jgi:mRNA interferase RelE/StbE
MLGLIQTNRFKQTYKKLAPNERSAVDKAVAAIDGKPTAGELKRGDLQGVRVYKFRVLGQLTLLGYRHDPEQRAILLLAVGPHENFYRDLKRS